MIDKLHTRRLYRSRTNVMLTGVAGGMAEYVDIDPTIVRVLFVLMSLLIPVLPVIYLILVMIMPVAPPDEPTVS